MRVEVEQEQDGRWIAEVTSIPGAMAYGASKQEAVDKVEAMVLRILADKVEHGITWQGATAGRAVKTVSDGTFISAD